MKEYIVIFSSEIEEMVNCAVNAGAKETASDLYGFITLEGWVIVMLATPPGPNAIQNFTTSSQDYEYFLKTYKKLTRQFGLQFLGDHHSHHFLNLCSPSPTDVRHIKSISLKNHFPRMVEIILNLEEKGNMGVAVGDDTHSSCNPRQHCKKSKWSDWGSQQSYDNHQIDRVNLYVTINPFLFYNASKGSYTRCPLKILPGESPFRKNLIEKGFLEEQKPIFPYPSAHIIINDGTTNYTRKVDHDISSGLIQQFRELPADIQDAICITTSESFITFTVPLPGDHTCYIFCNIETNLPEQVFLKKSGELQCSNITNRVILPKQLANMTSIYESILLILFHDEQKAIEDKRKKTKMNSRNVDDLSKTSKRLLAKNFKIIFKKAGRGIQFHRRRNIHKRRKNKC